MVNSNKLQPLLIDAMRKYPTGEVRHTPNNRPKTGTSTEGFLMELDEWVDAIRAEAYNDGYLEGYAKAKRGEQAEGRVLRAPRSAITGRFITSRETSQNDG